MNQPDLTTKSAKHPKREGFRSPDIFDSIGIFPCSIGVLGFFVAVDRSWFWAQVSADERAFAGKFQFRGGLHVIIPRENWRTTCFCDDSHGGLRRVGAWLRVPPVRFHFP